MKTKKNNITIIEQQKNLIQKIVNFLTNSDLKKQNKILKDKIIFLENKIKNFKEIEKDFFNQTKELAIKNSELKLTIRKLEKNLFNYNKEIQLRQQKEKQKQEKEQQQKQKYLKISETLKGKEKEFFTLYFLKDIKEKNKIMKKLKLNNIYYRQIKHKLNKIKTIKIK